MAKKDMIGTRFEKLLVIAQASSKADGTAAWVCVCDCGGIREVPGTKLRAGKHKSCGCSSPRFTTESVATHGQSRTRTYRIWRGMRQRCSDSATGKTRRLYFDKGIRVCERWNSFECFLNDMGHAPEWASIDRIDGDLGYEPGNCRWATKQEQANNTCANSLVTHNSETMTVSMWAERIGVKRNTLLYRLRRGIPVVQALQKEIVRTSTQRAASRARACLICGAEFIPRPAQITSGRGLYCSQSCSGKSKLKK